MALLDFKLFEDASFGYPGDMELNVADNASGQGTGVNYIKAFRPGEPVLCTPGSATVTSLYTTNSSGNTKPVVSTDFIYGIASSGSTETATAAGTVKVTKFTEGMTWLVKPTVAATWNLQSEYDALVGDRVLINLASGYAAGSYTLLAADNATYGCVVMPLDVSRYPGQVRIAFRNGLNGLA